MIRNWVKNLCSYIDDLDTNFSSDSGYPIVNGRRLYVGINYITTPSCIKKLGKYVLQAEINLNIVLINLEECEYILLKDSIDNFRYKVNEKRTIEFLKPFTYDSEDI